MAVVMYGESAVWCAAAATGRVLVQALAQDESAHSRSFGLSKSNELVEPVAGTQLRFALYYLFD